MQVRTDKGAKTAKYFFDSIQEMQRWIEETPRKWVCNTSEDTGATRSWDLNAGLKGSLAMAKDGWKEGAAKAGIALKSLPMRSAEPETKYDFYGFRGNVGRAISGAPDYMVRRKTDAENGSTRVLTLAVAINASAFTDAQHMSNYGIAIMHYVRQLEMKRVRAEIIVTCVEQLFDGTRVSVAIRVKQAGQPLNLSVLAFAIGHPAMFRRIMFAILERTDTKTDSGYGMPIDTKASDIVNIRPGTVILNGMNKASKVAQTPEDALKYVEEVVSAALNPVKAA